MWKKHEKINKKNWFIRRHENAARQLFHGLLKERKIFQGV